MGRGVTLAAMATQPDHVLRNRAAWDNLAASFAGPGLSAWSHDEPRWGEFAVPEAQAGVLPADVAGLDVIELGCGTDLAISEYGAAIWCDPYVWIPEAARLLRRSGLVVTDLIELQAPVGAVSSAATHSTEWAHQWPCEEVWKARKP